MTAAYIPVSGFPLSAWLNGFVLSIQSSTQSSIQRAILDGAERRDQLRHMKSMMLILLGVRLLFLVLACFGCIFAIISGLRTGVEWYWPAGGVLGLGLCGFLIGQVWASLKATWKQ